MFPHPFLAPFISGFSLGAGLIIAIGSQNAFVLRQGLKREHVFIVCSICFLCDFLLISLGAMGFGSLVAASPRLMMLSLWGGSAFLFFYGLRSFGSMLRPDVLECGTDNNSLKGAGQVVVAALGFGLLNPHAYLDTVVLLGSISGRYAGAARILFAAGSTLASLLWFYSIGYGARVLTPFFRAPASWRILDALVGCTMWGIAASLIWKQIATW